MLDLSKITALLCALPVSAVFALSQAIPPNVKSANSALQALKPAWIENTGQWDAQVAFRAQSFAGSVWLTLDAQVVHQFNGAPITAPLSANTPRNPRQPPAERAPGWVLTERFVGARAATPKGVEAQAGRVSFMLGDQTQPHDELRSFGEIALGELYPGVTVALRASGNNVEKRYTVAPFASPAAIRMRIHGAKVLSVDADGSLVAQTGNGPVRFTAPVAFQQRGGLEIPVKVRYRLDAKRQSYQFALAPYDRRAALVIDPLLHSTYLGGGGVDFATAVVVHPTSGSVIVAGSTTSTNFPGTAGGPQTSNGNSYDAFIARFSAGLTVRQQTTYFGGNGNDYAKALAVHPASGEVLVGGYTASTNLPGVGAGAQSGYGGAGDGFIVRFNSTLTTRLASTYYGGTAFDEITALAVNPASGEILAAGNTGSVGLVGTGSGASSVYSGGSDAFIVRFNATLTNILSATYGGSSSDDYAVSLAVHPHSGDVLLAGTTNSVFFPGTYGGFQPYKSNGNDVFLARFTPDLAIFLQSTFVGGDGDDYLGAMAVHPHNGEVIIAGWTNSHDFPGKDSGAQPVYELGMEGFISRVHPSLTGLINSTYQAGFGSDYIYALAIHPLSGEIFVAGATTSPVFLGVPPRALSVSPIQAENAGAPGGLTTSDAFVSRYNPTLTIRRNSTFLGGTGDDVANGIAIHPASGNLIVVGETRSSDFPIIAGATQSTHGGTSDAFVTRLSSDLSTLDLVPTAFSIAPQLGVPINSLRTAGPIQIVGLTGTSDAYVSGANSALCVSTTNACTCDVTPGIGFAATSTISNNHYLCVRHVSAPVVNAFAESVVVIGGFGAKFTSYTGAISSCLLDLDGNGTVSATSDGLMLVRAMLGMTGTAVTQGAISGTPPRADWTAIRDYLNKNCGTNFAP